MIQKIINQYFTLLLLSIFFFSCEKPITDFNSDEWKNSDRKTKGKIAQFFKENDSIIIGKSKEEIFSLFGEAEYSGENSGMKYVAYDVDIGTNYLHEFRIYFDSIENKAIALKLFD